MIENIVYVVILATAPAATAFPFMYGLFTPWWRTWVGRALLTKSVGVLLLVDVITAYQIFGEDWPYRQQVRLIAYAIVFVGVWLQFLTFAWLRFGPSAGSIITGRHNNES